MSAQPSKYVIDLHTVEKKPTLGKTSTGEGASFNLLVTIPRRISFARPEHLHEVLGAAGAPGCNDRDIHRPRHRTRKFTIETFSRAIPVHGSQQNFTRPAVLRFPCPLDRIAAGWRSASGHKCFETSWIPLGIDGDDHGL